MKTTFLIKTNWDYNPTKFEYREQLEEEAKRRSFEMISEGFTSGELFATIGKRECSGWWELDTINE